MKAMLVYYATALAFLPAVGRESSDYTVSPDTTNSGGGRAASAAYTIDHTVGAPGGAAAATDFVVRGGYAGQLFEVAALAVTADPANIAEGGNRQLGAAAGLDDDSLLALTPQDIAWSVVAGPLTGIDAAGLATAGLVWQDTPATARGLWAGLAGDLVLTVLDTLPDNYGSYAGDGLEDSWQFDHFGLDNPLAGPLLDPDGDGQDNLFEFTAGLDPVNPLSRFLLRIEPVAGQPGHKDLVFGPIVPGRAYTVLRSADLSSVSWQPLPGTPPTSDDGDERTVTDTAAGEPEKFYRVEIVRP